MTHTHCILIGAPVDSGKRRRGCLMGPDAFRTAGMAEAIAGLGHTVTDLGNLTPAAVSADAPKNPLVHALAENIGWTLVLQQAAMDAAPKGLPIFMGGDHALALGSVVGMAAHAKSIGRPLFVLWLDAHTDFHTPETTDSGNLHGTPVAYFTGLSGFDGFPAVDNPVPPQNVCMIGLRSVDPAEVAALNGLNMSLHDMRSIDEHGIRAPLAAFQTKGYRQPAIPPRTRRSSGRCSHAMSSNAGVLG